MKWNILNIRSNGHRTKQDNIIYTGLEYNTLPPDVSGYQHLWIDISRHTQTTLVSTMTTKSGTSFGRNKLLILLMTIPPMMLLMKLWCLLWRLLWRLLGRIQGRFPLTPWGHSQIVSPSQSCLVAWQRVELNSRVVTALPLALITHFGYFAAIVSFLCLD